MSARKSVYAITDHLCYGGVSPNAYVPKITAEVRVHFPPVAGVGQEAVLTALYASHEEAVRQVREYFEERI